MISMPYLSYFVLYSHNHIQLCTYTYLPGLLAGPSGIRVGWGIETNRRFEAERPPTLVGPSYIYAETYIFGWAIHIYAETKSTIMTNEHTSLEKYTSHSSFEMVAKGLRKGYEWEVSQRLNKLQHTDPPPVLLSLSALLSRSAGLLNRGSWGPIALCWVLVLSTASYLQLTEPVCGTGLYNCLSPTCLLWASHLHPIQPVQSKGYTLISFTGCTYSLIDGWVEG